MKHFSIRDLDEREFAAVLAGLRLLEGLGVGSVTVPDSDLLLGVCDIASSGDIIDELEPEEIDKLCVELNGIRNFDKQGYFEIDLPRLEEGWENFGIFPSWQEALSFCQMEFNADDLGRVSIIKELKKEEEDDNG